MVSLCIPTQYITWMDITIGWLSHTMKVHSHDDTISHAIGEEGTVAAQWDSNRGHL